MTYQIIYSSEATMPMQADDLEALLEHARGKNGSRGISGALVYAEGVFLQILEGDRVNLQALMARIAKDVRHETVTILQEGEIASAKFSDWKMAYVSATPDQVAKWAGISAAIGRDEVTSDVSADLHRTAQFAEDILALLSPQKGSAPSRYRDMDAGPVT